MPDPTIVSNPDLSAQITELTKVISGLAQTGTHATVSGIAAHVIEWLKGKPGFARLWTALSKRQKTIAAALTAALTSSGISYTWHVDPTDPHAYIFRVAGISMAAMGVFLWSFSQSFVFQQAWYIGLLKPKEVVGPAPSVTSTGSGGVAPDPVPVKAVP